MPRLFRSLFWALCLSFVCVSLAQAASSGICAVDGVGASGENPVCPTVTNMVYGDQSTYIGMAGEPGARINRNVRAHTPIYKHNVCRYITNSSGSTDYFIPFKTSGEWSSFLSTIQNAPLNASLHADHCAFPWLVNGLAYGPTSKKPDMGDGGDDQTYPAPALPFWRTGDYWPAGGTNPTHTFNHTCYQEYWQYKCWSGHWHDYQTCDPDVCNTTCNMVCFPVCPLPWFCFPVCGNNCNTSCSPGPCHDHHDWICDDNGSTCEKDWHSWTEVFDFSATALDGDTVGPGQPSWIPHTQRVGGTTRPDNVCTKRCNFNGHDCDCGNPPPQPADAAAGACVVPDQHMFDAYTMFYCSAHPQALMTCAAIGLVVINYENQVSAAPDNCTKAAIRTDENNSIDGVNAAAYALFIAYGGK